MGLNSNQSDNFGNYLKLLRKQKGLTLVKLQEETGISNSYLSQIENNQFTPSNDILRKLATFYKIDYFMLANKAGHFSNEEYEEIKKGKLIVRPNFDEEYKFVTHHLDRILKKEGDEWTTVTVKYENKEMSKEDKKKIIKFIETFIMGEGD